MKIQKILLASALLIMATGATLAQQPLDAYVARLGPQDHFNSSGVRLKSAAAIIRQDRANFHKFGRADGDDEGDTFFASKANRARMERMLSRGRASRATINRIVNGQPLIHVKVYPNFIQVDLID